MVLDSNPSDCTDDLLRAAEGAQGVLALRGYCYVNGGGNGQSIGSTVSDAIVRAWP